MRKSFLLCLLMVLALFAPWATVQADDLIVADGTETNSYVPVYGLYADDYNHTQILYPADLLEDLAGGEISELEFYLSSPASASWGSAVFEFRLMNVANNVSLSTTALDVSSATLVYSGALDGTQSAMTVTLSEEFPYEGEGLLLDIRQTVEGTYKSASFYGVEMSGASYHAYNSSSVPSTLNARNFLPKTKFTYTSGAPAACPKPKSLSYSDLQKRQVQLSWDANGSSATAWQICLNGDESNLRSADSNPFVLNGLQPSTDYSAKVRANCGGEDGDSDWSNEIHFSTPVACATPVFSSSSISNITATSADLSWEGSAENGFKVMYRTAAYTDGLDEKFDGSSCPDGWSMYTGLFDEASGSVTLNSATYGWSFGTGNGVFDSHARVNIYGSYQRWLVSPLYKQKVANLTFNLALTAYSGSVAAPDASGSDDKFIVLVQEAGSDRWEVLRKWDNAGSKDVFNNIACSAKGEDVSIDMSAYLNKNVRIAFYGESTTSNADNNLHIDNISSGIAYAAGAWQETGSTNTSMTLSGLTPEKPYEVKIQANCGTTDGLSEESEVGHFTTLSSCEKSTSLAASGITASAASISWDGAGQSSFNLRYRVKGSSSWTAENNISGSTYSLSGLDANTPYEVEVQPTCADADVWSDVFEFRTVCAPLAANGWFDGFEDEGDFFCWTVGNMESTSSYIPSRGSSYKHDGSYGLQLNAYKYFYYEGYSYNTDADGAYAVLPAFDFGEKSLKDFSMSLWAKSYSSSTSYSSYNQHLLVGVVSSPDDMSSFEQVADLELTTSFAQYEINFSAYLGSGEYIVLLAKVDPASSASSKYGQFYVDDLSLYLTPTCQPLASIAISDIDRRSLKVNLQPKAGLELADFYDLVYSASELDAAGLAEASFVSISKDNFPYVINGLDRETPYYIYVRANCGSEDGVSEWVSASATTKGLSGCDEIAVGSGSEESSYIPTHSNWDYSLTEQIYTPAEIGQSGNISSIAFYNSGSEKTRTIDVYMLHTSKAAFESTSDWVYVSNEQKVFSGSVTFEEEVWTTLTLSSPFAYNGEDNLLIVVDDNSDNFSSGLSCRTFTSSGDDYQVLYKYQDDTNIDPTNTTIAGTRSYAKNQIQFSFCHDLPACPVVSDLAFELVGDGTSEANIGWNIDNADYLTGFEVVLSESEISDFSEVTPIQIQESQINFNTLSAGTHYYVYVRANCAGESDPADQNSEWAGIDFITNADCPEVHNLSAELSGLNAANASWEKAFADQEEHFQYILSKSELDAAALEAGDPIAVDDATGITLADLDYNQQYHLYVASVCGAAHSDYMHVEFTTMPSCPAVINIAADRIEHNMVELSWESAQFASESSWQVGLVGDEANAQVVSERKAVLFGLNPETGYTAFVKAICSEASEAANFAFTTAVQPGSCLQVGEGTSTEYGPVCSYYGYERNGYIFTAADGLDRTGNIEALSWSGSAVKSVPVKIYLKNTAETAFSTSSTWNELISDATLVYDASVSTANGWYDVDIIDFNYTGENLMILVASNYGGSGNGAVNSPYFNASGSYAHIYARKDNNISDDAAISSFSSQGRNNHLPNTKFCFEAKACPDVKALAISDITTSSAKASWEPMGSESAWNVFISESAVTDFSDLSGYTVEQVSALSKSFEGLLDDQDYFVYVQPDCSGADFSMVSFRTIASCKAVTDMAASADAHTATVTWTDLNETPAGNYRIAYGPADAFDLSDENTYQTSESAELSGLNAETAYKFAVKAICSGEDESRWSEIASFTTLPSCYAPTAVAVDAASITSNSATVSWTDEHDDAGYIVAYGPAASFDINDPATYETANANAKSVELTGLDAATAYTFMVQGDCSSINEGFSSSWSPAGSFITACEAVVSFPWSENFNSLTAGIPVCWDNSEGTTTTESYKWNYYADGHDGVGLRFNSYSNSSNNTNILKTPTIAIADKALILSFWYKNPTGGDFSVYYSIGDDEPVALATGLTGISSWTLKEITLPAECLNSNVEILFKGTSNWGNGDAYIYLDDVKVEEMPECVKPTGLALGADGVSTSSAQLTWTAGGNETNWKLRYKKQTEEEWTVISDPITANPYTLTGLDAATAYDVQIAAWCNTEDAEAISEFSAALSFFTACEAVASFPWSENFNSLTAGIPVCWDNSEGTTTTESYKWNYYADGHDGVGLRFNSYSNSSNNTNILKTPTIAIADKALILSFWYKNPTGGDFSVYYSIGDDEPVALATGLTGISSWTLKEITLPAECLNSNVEILFKGTSNWGNGDAYIYLDDVKVEEMPECVKPTGLALGADGVSTSSAQLTWTAGGNETNWKLRYKKQTEEEWTVISDPITANPYTLTGLDAATAYDVQIAAWCNTEDAEAISEFSAALSFFTACEAVASFPWNENFDGRTNGNINFDCWTNEHISGNGSYIFQVADGTGGNSTKLGKLPDMSSGTITELTLPVMSIPAANAYEFIIDVYRNASGTSYTGEGLRILAVQGEESTELGFISRNCKQSSTIGEVVIVPAESATGWYTYRFTIPYADAMNIVVRGESKYGSATYFDNLIVRELPSCEKPTGLAIGAEGVSTHSAQLAWTAGEAEQSAWQICLNGDEENLIDADTNPFVLSNLTAATAYNAKVRANCGGSYSEWSNAVAFATEVCEEADKKAIRYVLTDQYSDTWNGASITVKDKITNAEVAVVTMSSSTASEEGVVNLCCDREYSFVFASGSYPKECGYVFYDLNGDVILQKATGATAPSAGVMLDYTMVCPTCYKPSAIQASGINASSAVISWTEGADESAWQVAYSTDADFDPNEAALTEATATSITLSGLEASTTYYIYVRANCGADDKSAWSEPISFTTVAACQLPDGLSVENITESSASISWNTYNQSGFKLRYSEDGTNWTSIENAAMPQLIEGLDANTAYQVQVQVGCNTEEWSEALNFKTACDIWSIVSDGNYVEGFEDYTGSTYSANGVAPDCWDVAADQSVKPHVIGSGSYYYKHDGTKALTFYGSGNCYAALPLFAEALSELQISFWMQTESASYGTLSLGYITAADPGDFSTFTEIESFANNSGSMVQREKIMDAVPVEAARLVFRWAYTGSTYYMACIDDIKVSLAPTCFKPSALNIANISTNSAELSWTNGKNESAWQICLNDDEENLIDASANPFLLENLNSNTAYSVKVRANCGGSDVSEWSEAVQFTTNCEAITALPWEENFNDKQKDKVADCWDNSASGSSTLASNPERIWGVYENSGNRMIRMFNYYVQNGTALINTPSIVLPDGSKYELSFDYSNRANCGAFLVKVSVDGGAFEAIDGASYAAAGTTNNTDPGTFSSAAIDMSAYAGHIVMLQFFANATYSQGAIFVDNISLHEKAACSEAPTALSASTADANSINLSWTKGDDEEAWNVRYRISGSSAWNIVNEITTLVSGNSCSATLEALEAETTYEIQVQAHCDAEHQSDWSNEAVASTECGIKAMPFSENFNDLNTGIPTCWDNSEGTTSNDSYKWNYVAAGHEGSAVRFNSFNNASGNTNLLKTPAIQISDAAALNFWYKNETGGDFSVFYSINGSEPVALASGLTNQAEWIQKSCPLPAECVGQNVVFIFKGTSNNSYGSEPYIYLDEVSVVRAIILNDNTADTEAQLSGLIGENVDITINRTFFRKGYFNTICLPFDLPSFENTPFDVPGAELWSFKYGSVENGELNLRIVETNGLVAGVPYLIRFDDAEEDIVNPTFHGVTIKESVGKSVGQTDEVQFIGILKPEYFTTEGDDVQKKLFLLANDKLAWAGVANNLKSFRAYFLTTENVSGVPVSNNMPARLVMHEEVITGVGNAQGEIESIKRIENDQVIIIRNGVKYSVQGQIISK